MKKTRRIKACKHDLEKPIRKGRANYECRKCGANITLHLVFMHEATLLPNRTKRK